MRLGRLGAISAGVVALVGVLLTPPATADTDNEVYLVATRSNADLGLELGASIENELEEARRQGIDVQKVGDEATARAGSLKSQADSTQSTPGRKSKPDTTGVYDQSPDPEEKTKVPLQAGRDLSAEECRAIEEGGESSGLGIAVDRFTFCRWGNNSTIAIDKDGVIQGWVSFLETETANGSNKARSSVHDVYVSNVLWTGIFGPQTPMKYWQRSWTGADQEPEDCTINGSPYDGGTNWYEATVGEWKADGETWLHHDLTSPEEAGKGTDNLSECGWNHMYTVDAGAEYITNPSSSKTVQTWYDSSQSFGAVLNTEFPAGAVFGQATPEFSYFHEDPEVLGVARHIYTALNLPETTHPPKEDGSPKIIPGNVRGTEYRPIERNWPGYNDAAQEVSNRNKAAKDRACAQLQRPDDTYQCDEYPFASTVQGAGYGDGNFSVWYVPGDENNKAGQRLQRWYAENRIVHGDEYGMNIEER